MFHLLCMDFPIHPQFMIQGFILMEQKKYIYHFLCSNSYTFCALKAVMKSPGQQLGGIAIVSTAFLDIPFVMQRLHYLCFHELMLRAHFEAIICDVS